MAQGVGGLVSNMGISRRLWLAFGLLLVLLVAQAGVALVNISRSGDNVEELLRSSDVSTLAKDLETRMANLRIEARNYLYSGDVAFVGRMRDARAGLEKVLADNQALIRASGHADRFAAFTASHGDYHGEFERVRQMREQLDTLMRERMEPVGARISQTLETISDGAQGSGETASAFQIEKAITHWMLVRLATNHADDAKVLQEVDENLGEASEHLEEAARLSAVPERQRQLREAKDALPAFRTAFKDVVGLHREIARYRDDVMLKAGKRVADAATAIVTAAHEAEDTVARTAEDDGRLSLILTLAIAGASLLLGIGAAAVIAGSIMRPVMGIKGVMTDLTDGHLNVAVPHTDGRDELGDMARAVAAFKDESVGALRSRIALDRVSANIMMADAEGTITYANGALLEMFKAAEADIRKAFPGFDADQLVGRSIDMFHKDAAGTRRLLAGLTGTHRSTAIIGRRTFFITVNPVVGRHGDRLGTVIEWKDKTDELAIEAEISSMVEAAVRGDFTRRIDMHGKAGFFKLVSEGINRLAENVANVADELASALEGLSQGDLTRRIDRHYDGIFHRLKEDFNATAEKLSEIVKRINSAAESIGQSSREVAAGSLDLSERTEQQASSLEETAASMEELAATVRSNADNAQQVNTFAVEARTAAEKGGTVAASAVDAMRRIEESSRKISDIIGVIDEIAFQTNLLALNAAVEAARAGDAGRGFAVVAQEVRNLAQRSAQASKEIKGLILASDSQVRDGVQLVQKAGDALGGIVSGVQQVATLISGMAAASGEQASALDEINAAVAQMDEMTQKNAALVEETTAAAQAMAGQAGDLKTLVGFFKLDQAAVATRPAWQAPAPKPAAAVRPVVQRTVRATKPAPASKPAAAPKPVAAPKVAAGGTLRHVADAADDDWKEF